MSENYDIMFESRLLGAVMDFLAGNINKDDFETLQRLNQELERRVAKRTKKLERQNWELALLNRLIAPIEPPCCAAKIIEGCLAEFREYTGIEAKLTLFADPVGSSLGSYEDIVADEACNWEGGETLPICSGRLTFGYLGFSDQKPLCEVDLKFLHTLARSAGVIMQNEILLRTNHQNHAVLRAVLESLCDAIMLIDNRGRVAYANRRMTGLLGVTCDRLRELPENELFRIIEGMWLEQSQDTLGTIRSENGIYRIKVRQCGGLERFLMVSAFPVTAEDKSIIGKGYLFRDITTEQEVEKLKSDLIALVSHEFKTPITSIKGSVETLLRQDADWSEQFEAEMLIGIHEDIEHIQELVEDWLDLSKIEAGAIRLNREPIRPEAVVENAVRRMPKHLGDMILLENSVWGNMPLIYGDRVRLEQVMSNLLTNAIRYNDRQPHIKISAYSDETYVHIRVEDNGIGIREEYLDKVFERLYSSGLTRRNGGTGLGLAICKGIMDAHKGSIRAESTKDVGSAFTIAIPKYRYSR